MNTPKDDISAYQMPEVKFDLYRKLHGEDIMRTVYQILPIVQNLGDPDEVARSILCTPQVLGFRIPDTGSEGLAARKKFHLAVRDVFMQLHDNLDKAVQISLYLHNTFKHVPIEPLTMKAISPALMSGMNFLHEKLLIEAYFTNFLSRGVYRTTHKTIQAAEF